MFSEIEASFFNEGFGLPVVSVAMVDDSYDVDVDGRQPPLAANDDDNIDLLMAGEVLKCMHELNNPPNRIIQQMSVSNARPAL